MIGHDWAVKLLAEHVALGHERHAYLLTGPSGVGKHTLAMRLAQSLNCQEPPSAGQPCLICPSCKRFAQMNHPDLAMVMSEREGETLKIEQIRELQHTISLTPYEARYRVAIILRFEEAHSSAANAMLKTLEEPPDHVVVILTARSPEDLLPTIVSRCELLNLRPLSIDETASGLHTLRGVPEEMAEKLAHISDGRPGYAIRLFEQPKILELRQLWLEELIQILGASLRERFAFSKGLVEDKEKLRDELQLWLTFWRDVLIYGSGIRHPITNIDYIDQIQKLGGVIDMEMAKNQVNAVERTIRYINHNVNARQAIEVLLMDFPKVNLIS